MLYQQQQNRSYHEMQQRYANNGYVDTENDNQIYGNYWPADQPHTYSVDRKRRSKEVSRNPSNAEGRSRSATNPYMHYVEAGYPRVPRWANWRSPYPHRESDMMPY